MLFYKNVENLGKYVSIRQNEKTILFVFQIKVISATNIISSDDRPESSDKGYVSFVFSYII